MAAGDASAALLDTGKPHTASKNALEQCDAACLCLHLSAVSATPATIDRPHLSAQPMPPRRISSSRKFHRFLWSSVGSSPTLLIEVSPALIAGLRQPNNFSRQGDRLYEPAMDGRSSRRRRGVNETPGVAPSPPDATFKRCSPIRNGTG